MKQFDKVIVKVIVVSVLLLVIGNVFIRSIKYETDNSYKVELSRIEKELSTYEKEKGEAPADINELMKFSKTEYKYIKGFCCCEKDNIAEIDKCVEMYSGNSMTVVTEENIYFIEVEFKIKKDSRIYTMFNVFMLSGIVLIAAVLLFIRKSILGPFHRLSELPYEIAKGNMTKPLNESENRYFGRYIWGMNMLRENLEDSKKRELALIKEKKLLLMSLSHDVKTPLSAIKLYVKALEKNLYNDEKKKENALNHINNNADEIEKYISQIVTASNEDFMKFEVENTEIYVDEVIDEIVRYYKEKLETLQIEFNVDRGTNCMIYACHDRIIEVVQNIIENVIKYGDGKRINLKCQSEDECYILIIENTGCLLENKELPHLFESFYRGSNVGRNSGSGLGLYICRELVRLMEGEIFAEIIEDDKERNMVVKVVLRKNI